jgi:hypothetical protein
VDCHKWPKLCSSLARANLHVAFLEHTGELFGCNTQSFALPRIAHLPSRMHINNWTPSTAESWFKESRK